MIQFIAGLLLTIILGFLSYYILPWWGFVLVTACIGFGLQMNNLSSFACGFLGVALLWGGYAYWIDSANSGMFATKVAEVLKQGSGARLWWMTTLIGAVLGSFAMLTGKLGRDLIQAKETGGKRGRRSKYRGKYQ